MQDEGDSKGEGKGEQDRFFRATWLIAALTVLSRIFGMVRDMVLVPLGKGAAADAFWVAFAVPHLFRRLFGEGALTAAFVPVFTESAEKAGWQRARLVLGNTAALLVAVLSGLAILIEAGLLAWALMFGGPWGSQIAIHLTMVMLPFTVGVCLLALLSAAMNCRGQFAYPAAAPMLLNAGLIVGAWLAPHVAESSMGQFYVEAVALLASNAVQLVVAMWLIRRGGLSGPWRVLPILPETRSIARTMAPMLLPLSLMQVTELLTRLVAKGLTASDAHPGFPLAPGVVRCHHAASMLYLFPMGVLGVSLSTAVFPLMSRCAARNDEAGLRQVLTRAIRLCFFLGIPSGVGLILLARPLVEVIFRRGEFTGGPDPLSDVSRTAVMLQMYALAMPAYFCAGLLLRVFYARKETLAPLVVSGVLGVLNVALVLGGIFTPLRSASLGLAAAIVAVANTAVFAWMLQKRVGRLAWGEVFRSAVGVAVASATMVPAALAMLAWVRSLEGAARMAYLGPAAASALPACVLAAAWWLRRRRASLSWADLPACLAVGVALAAGTVAVAAGALWYRPRWVQRPLMLLGPCAAAAAVFLLAAILLRCPELAELRPARRGGISPPTPQGPGGDATAPTSANGV